MIYGLGCWGSVFQGVALGVGVSGLWAGSFKSSSSVRIGHQSPGQAYSGEGAVKS